LPIRRRLAQAHGDVKEWHRRSFGLEDSTLGTVDHFDKLSINISVIIT
jgi:hypothetical protein